MDHLRERVAAPELSENETPMEARVLAIIKSGIQRLREERIRVEGGQEEARRLLGVEGYDF